MPSNKKQKPALSSVIIPESHASRLKTTRANVRNKLAGPKDTSHEDGPYLYELMLASARSANKGAENIIRGRIEQILGDLILDADRLSAEETMEGLAELLSLYQLINDSEGIARASEAIHNIETEMALRKK